MEIICCVVDGTPLPSIYKDSTRWNALILFISGHFSFISFLYMIYFAKLQLVCHPVAAVQYTFTHKQYTERHKTNRTTQQMFGRVRAVPRLCELYPGICLTTEEKARKKTLSQGSLVASPLRLLHVKAHFAVLTSTPLVAVLCRMNPLHSFTRCLFKVILF